MSSVSALAQRLAVVAGFESPQVSLEQYRTPPALAARLVHDADLQGDIDGRFVVDLGTGTGMLALAAALRGPTGVVGIDIDAGPLSTARENERRVGTAADISWLRADATDAPLNTGEETTVVMNPPFGAQDENEHADRAFLATAARISDVSYSVHNAGSQEFVASFAADNAGEVTRKFRAELDLPRAFDFHSEESRTMATEIFRIEWD
jgi:putative methylase